MGYVQNGPTMGYGQRPRGPLARFGLGDEDSGVGTIAKVLEAFLPKLQEIQAAGDAQAQAQVDKVIADATGGKPAASATQTASGSNSTASVGGADFVNKNGVCKPKNFPALTAAKDLQMQLNRIAKAKSIGTIVVDGDIGPGTVGLVGRCNTIGAGIPGAGSCATITGVLPAATQSAKAFADKIGAPPPTATEVSNANQSGAITVTSTTGQELLFKPPGVQAGMLEKLKSLPETVKILGGGALVLGGILLFKRVRGGRRSSSSSSASSPVMALPAGVPLTSNPARRRRRRGRR